MSATILSLATSAASMSTSVSLPCSDSAKPARFKLAAFLPTLGEVVVHLRRMGSRDVALTLPKCEEGGLSLSFRGVYKASVLADLLVSAYGVIDPTTTPTVQTEPVKASKGKGKPVVVDTTVSQAANPPVA